MSVSGKIVGDIVLGPIVFHGKEATLIETAELARLREIKQLSTVYFFNNSARHSRWDHSIGMAGLVKIFLAAQPAGSVSLSDQSDLVSAALLHDSGHSAWSHVGELFSSFVGRPIKHDVLSAELVRGTKKYDKYFEKWNLPRVRDILTSKSQRETVAMMIEGKSPVLVSKNDKEHAPKKELQEEIRSRIFLGNIINGPADFDQAEFLIRDSFMCMSGQGFVDLRGIVRHLGIVETSGGSKVLAFLNLHFAESMICARELLYQGVYLETHNSVTEEVFIRALNHTYEPKEILDFWFSTDDDVMERLHEQAKSDPFVDRICKLFRVCQTYDLIQDVNLNDQRLNKQARENIKFLGGKGGRRILLNLEEEICKELHVPVGDIIIGCWSWKKPPLSDASTHIGGRDSTVDYESPFLNALTQDTYVSSRTRLVVACWREVSVPKATILSEVLKKLGSKDYATPLD